MPKVRVQWCRLLYAVMQDASQYTENFEFAGFQHLMTSARPRRETLNLAGKRKGWQNSHLSRLRHGFDHEMSPALVWPLSAGIIAGLSNLDFAPLYRTD